MADPKIRITSTGAERITSAGSVRTTTIPLVIPVFGNQIQTIDMIVDFGGVVRGSNPFPSAEGGSWGPSPGWD